MSVFQKKAAATNVTACVRFVPQNAIYIELRLRITTVTKSLIHL
jgi:hypothetical protein